MRKLFIFCLIACCTFLTSCGDDLGPTDAERQIEQDLFTMINIHRNGMGLYLLSRDEFMDDQARAHSQAMAQANTLLFSEGFSERTNEITSELGSGAVAENEASFQGEDIAQGLLNLWLMSSGHRALIEGDYLQTGLAVAKSETDVYFATQIFWKG